MSNRKLDAELAVKYHGWEWIEYPVGNKFLCPPIDSEMFSWTGMWDEDGIPHYLPRYSEMEEELSTASPIREKHSVRTLSGKRLTDL